MSLNDAVISSNTAAESTVIGPLNFKDDQENHPPATRLVDYSRVACMLCDNIYDFTNGDTKDQYLVHLYMIHRLVIGDVEDIDCLASYNKFWKEKFQNHPLEKFCSAMLMNQLPDGTPACNEKYFLLSNIEPLDYDLRESIKRDVMKMVLERHQFERTNQSFNRKCLYCKESEMKTRAAYLEHLYAKHFLQLGKAENLVFVDELVETVQDKMDKLICLFCEKVFKDRPTLKEHMRKKGHKRINPYNKLYDRFFLINYRNDRLKKGPELKKHASAKVENKHGPEISPFHSDDSDSDWSDWYGEEQQTTCLFCSIAKSRVEELKTHMKSMHNFDFDLQVAGLSFYQRVKIVNYIRRQMHILRCVICREEFTSKDQLQDHLEKQLHFGIGEQQYWDQPEFFFPTYEDDQFLCNLEDADPEQSDDNLVVFSEKVSANVSTEAESLSMENFKLT
ncbi:zinc finger protein 277 [Wyeomyia smithii]|uniref:zinc finger protein 277 n=1 Tax=Wyeomyia smithii TaxID=174621 RepID=UPI00246808A0|nr:zinc finger protein 277 [Wyeomyia smithii]